MILGVVRQMLDFVIKRSSVKILRSTVLSDVRAEQLRLVKEQDYEKKRLYFD